MSHDHNSRNNARAMTRRDFCSTVVGAAAAVASGSIAAPALAQPAKAGALEKELVFSSRGGSLGNVYKTKIIPPFEQKYSCKVTMVVNDSGPALSKVLAEKANPQTDVLWTVEPTHARGVANDLFDRIDAARVPNLERTYDFARGKDGIGVAWGIGATVIAYNREIFDQRKIAAPKSWKDIITPETKGHVVWLDLSTQQGINTFLMVNRVLGGSESNVDPIFRYLKANLSNITVVTSPAQIDDLLLQKDAWIATNIDARFAILKDKGFPLEIVFPSEGLPQQSGILDIIKGAPHPNLANAFVNWVLSDEMQTIVGNDIQLGPVTKFVKLDPKVQASLVYGPERTSKLLQFDYAIITRDQAKWIDRWNRELA
jgi:putative spermidine/putrescine transport system substrate-binding protein